MTYPRSLQYVNRNTTITLMATAQDDFSGSGVSRVQFLVDGVTPATCRTPDDTLPYTCQWTVPNNISKYFYDIIAKAWDKAGNVRTSAVIRVMSR